MKRYGLIAVTLLGVTLAVSVAARPGIYEYWKPKTRTTRTKSTLPPTSSRTSQTSQSTTKRADRGPAPWTQSWFSDSALVGKQVAEMTRTLEVPLIGESYPLPKGGGFACFQPEGMAPERGLTCVLRCSGPELGGRRENWFYVNAPNGLPILDRVRWRIVPSGPTSPTSWRQVYRSLSNSLSRSMGSPTWTGPDSTVASWNGPDYATSVRLHGSRARVDSLEIECLSNRFAASSATDPQP